MVEGEPGSGKTTFMKSLCRAWASGQKSASCDIENEKRTNTANSEVNGEESTSRDKKNSDITTTTESKHLQDDSVLLAFLLRQIRAEDRQRNLFDLIISQFPFLNCAEIYSVLNHVHFHPSNVYLFFDGFDELRRLNGNQIVDVITGIENENVSRIITTRSQGIIQLYRHNPKAAQAHVKLLGFDNKQIKEYIYRYYNLEPQVASAMIKNITDENLWKLASIPIRLQMMCFVWKIYRKLGKSMAELYKMLLKGLLGHMETRGGKPEEHSETTGKKDLMEKYHESILLPTAKLANRWDDSGNLIILFPFTDIEKVTGENVQKVINFGCITKYFSFSIMKQNWNFSHLSLQEYFVAYHIAYSDESSVRDFFNKCKNIHTLERNRTILEFLCFLAPKVSNEIITEVVTQDRSEIENVQILSNVLVLMKAYEKLSLVDIPLPSSVVLCSSEKFPKRFAEFNRLLLSYLFSKDHKCHKNMAVLKVHDLEKLPTEAQVDYLKGFFVTVSEREQLKRLNALLPQLSKEASMLGIDFAHSTIVQSDIRTILAGMQARSIKIFSIKGNGVIALASEILQQQPKLELLAVSDRETYTKGASHHIQSLSREANKSKHLMELKLSGSVLDSSITTLSNRIKVTVCSKYNDMEKFIKVSKGAASSSSNIAELDLSFSNFGTDLEPGELIGNIFIYLQTLISIKLRSCGLTTKDVLQIERTILNSKIAIQELDLLGNKIKHCYDLQGVLDRCPDLNVLLMTFINECKLPERLKEIRVIVATGTKQVEPVLKLTESMYPLHKLYIINAFPDFSEMNMSNGPCKLKILYFLDTPDHDEALVLLSKNVEYMENLEELRFISMEPRTIKSFTDMLKLVNHLPSSLKHLDLYGYESDDLVHILQGKHKMKDFLTLNIGSFRTSQDIIQIIRQELQEINQKVEVYCDKEECLMSLISYSTVNPPSTVTMQSVEDAYDLLEVLS